MEASTKGRQTIRYAPISFPFGQLCVAYRGKVICCVGLGSGTRRFERACAREFGVRPIRDAHLPGDLAKQVVDHMRGRRSFGGPLELSELTPFQRMVLTKTLEIPVGEVRSYQWVAKEVGAERAVRAVGTALARNPIPFLIPCHRVVRADGRIGRYSAGGPSMKAKLLAFEGVEVEKLATLAARRIRFVGSAETKIFCLPTCHRARRISKPHVNHFSTREDAVRKSYRACRACRPA